MAIFDRIRRPRGAGTTTAAPLTHALIPEHLLPEINQRVTVTMGEHVPVPSRVEDVIGSGILLALPALPLEFGDRVVVTWERDDAWFSLEAPVLGIDARAAVPTVQISNAGRLARYDERRSDIRRVVKLDIDLRVVRARAVRPGHELHTHTVEVSSNAIRFESSAPFAPGDLIEATLHLGEGARDLVNVRVRVIRVDAVSGSWRSTCTAAYDEILRSDRARLVAVADARGVEVLEPDVEPASADPSEHASEPTTLDGVGGRDAPQELNDLHGVIDWLRRRG